MLLLKYFQMDCINSVWPLVINPQEGDAIDADLDKQEVLEPKEGELCGDELLRLHYALVSWKIGSSIKSKKTQRILFACNRCLINEGLIRTKDKDL